MGFLFLLVVVFAITATSLVAKLSSRNNVTALDLSTSLFAVGAIIGAVILCGHLPVGEKGTRHIVRGKGGEALSKTKCDMPEITPTRQIGARFGRNNPDAAKRSQARVNGDW